MDTIEMTSDCDFLHNIYEPDSKVGIRIKSILIRIIESLIETDKESLKRISINNVPLIGENNEVNIKIGSLAGEEFAPAEESTISLEKDKKYAVILNNNGIIPLKYIHSGILSLGKNTISSLFPVGSTYTTVSWVENNEEKGIKEVPQAINQALGNTSNWVEIKKEEITEDSIARTVKTWLRTS